MKYKQLIVQKLIELENRLNTMNSLISMGERDYYFEHSSLLKEKIEEIQTLINTED